MSDVPQGAVSGPGDPDHEIFDLRAFHENGLLWALNRFVLHPRGLAMWVHYAPAGEPIEEQETAGWGIARAEDGIFSFESDLDLLGRAKFEAFMEYVAARSNAPTDEPSPRHGNPR